MPRTSALAVDPVLDAFETEVLRLLLTQRECLPHARNGQPQAPSDAYAAQVAKDMGQGRSREVRRLLALMLCNVRDGVPLETVKLVTRRLEAACEHVAGAPRLRPLTVLNRRETREQCLLDLAQLRVQANEEDPDALTALIAHCAQYAEILSEIMTEAERALMECLAGPAVAAPSHRLTLLK
jgi:DnaJ-domain-containing protein 1